MLDTFKKILKKNGLKGKDFAENIGITYGSYRSQTKPKAKSTPRWVKSFVWGYRLGKLGSIDVVDHEEL